MGVIFKHTKSFKPLIPISVGCWLGYTEKGSLRKFYIHDRDYANFISLPHQVEINDIHFLFFEIRNWLYVNYTFRGENRLLQLIHINVNKHDDLIARQQWDRYAQKSPEDV